MTCPKCGGERHTLWGPTHPLMLHWRLNPAIATNELALGQRVTSTWICESCGGPVQDRSYTPCPSCRAMHPTSIWRLPNALGRWSGLRCPSCDAALPPIRNLWARGIERLTSPLWSGLDPERVAGLGARIRGGAWRWVMAAGYGAWFAAGLLFGAAGIAVGLCIFSASIAYLGALLAGGL